ncbi:MAG: TrmH family RNA methyltransferase, partial [Flavobacteriales bacterium]|nr:TrmH family RNA methyltransferase [Flavobacteriales bacterium]
MLSKGKIKKINSLKEKKSRQISQLFTIEGIKSVKEIAISTSISIKELYTTPETHSQIPEIEGVISQIITKEEFEKISSQSTPEGVLAVCAIPQYTEINWQKDTLYIALDNVRDPGNLGTIVRLADWFGVQDIICTSSTVDLYNPKTVQSTMGSIARVRVHYTD